VDSGSWKRAKEAPETLADGRYTLLERIGQGAAGTVYRARDNGGMGHRIVCIKRLSGSLAPHHARALREEARLLMSVRHANVVSLFAVGEEMDLPFLVLELIDGLDLRALCRALAGVPGQHAPSSARSWSGQLPDLIAVHVACAVLRALAAVQRAIPGLVHRDVTPHNILVSDEGEIKLADFGIALATDRGSLVRPRAIKGKYGYMAPEQIRGEPLDVRTDLFAVGVLLYELLAKVRPCGPMQGMDELCATERGDLLPLTLHRPRLDRGLLVCVARLLALRREDRFACADDALRALAPFSAGEMGSLRLAALVRRARRGDTDSAPEIDQTSPARTSSSETSAATRTSPVPDRADDDD
jgi:serine/threonine-protein kinase